MADYSNKNLIEYEAAVKREKFTSLIFLLFICTFLIFCFYLRTEVYMLVSVKGSSMCNTLFDGDLLLADKTSTVDRGDVVVVLKNEVKDEALIKRVIGLEGDTIWTEDGYVYRSYVDKNGQTVSEKLEEYYLYRQGSTRIYDKVTVPEGCIYIMGDNRDISSDSRSFGAVELNCVLGIVPQWSINIKDSKFVTWYKEALNG